MQPSVVNAYNQANLAFSPTSDLYQRLVVQEQKADSIGGNGDS